MKTSPAGPKTRDLTSMMLSSLAVLETSLLDHCTGTNGSAFVIFYYFGCVCECVCV